MGAPKYASGKYALGLCDLCSFRYKLKDLKPVYRRGINTHLLVCKTCHDPDHPQNFQGMYPVHDPQALRNPRSDSKERDISRDISTLFYSDSFDANNGWVLGEGWNINGGENYAVDIKESSIIKTFDIVLSRQILLSIEIVELRGGEVLFTIDGEQVGDSANTTGVLEVTTTPNKSVMSVGIVGRNFRGSVDNFELWLV